MVRASAPTHAAPHSTEVSSGKRFEFGKNWSFFLASIDEDRILAAERSLQRMLEAENLGGKSFLDIGSGSGLFSLAARRLGARVHSFDYDPQSVACTTALRRRYFPDDNDWVVEEGSALDIDYLKGLGRFDVVYSWGVLHHTGQMWQALGNAALPAATGGRLFLALYNDMGNQSVRWRWIKRTYNILPSFLRIPFAVIVIAPYQTKSALRSFATGVTGGWKRSTRLNPQRGMSRWRDILDWVGGYPYEVARPEEVFEFYKARGFTLSKMKCGGVGLGCNEFVFVRTSESQ